MCTPMALAGVAIAGGVIRGVGAIAQGISARRSYLDQAALSTRQAEQERLRGLYEVAQYKRQQSQLFSTTRTVVAASGVGLSGSALEVLNDQAEQTEIDLAAIKYGAEVDARNFEYQAKIDTGNARRALIGSFFGAAGQVISGVSSAIQLSPNNRSVLQTGYTL